MRDRPCQRIHRHPLGDMDYETWVTAEDPLHALVGILKQAGFTEDSVKECLANQKILDGVEWVRKRAQDEFHVDSTPTFFINGKKYNGAMSFEEMQKIIDPLLKA